MIDAGYTLVAEGIEEESIHTRVRELGFSYAQGFHLGRPVAFDNPPGVSTRQTRAMAMSSPGNP
ncbi:MAG: EAL domain-containing protein [Hydrogenophilaceae bacterium]|nr:EAL domain-containing protein [Hydrogenophilaceae bacterium]